MRLFELRACWEEFYDCPDNGATKICDTYNTVAFAVGDDTKLKTIASDLAAGFHGGFWSKKRSDHLHKIYPEYDEFRDTKYKIIEVTDLIIMSNNNQIMEDQDNERTL